MQHTGSSSWFYFGVGALAVWRLTHLLNAEDGPFDVFVRLRGVLGGGFFGHLLDCFYCLSLWVATPAAWLIGGNAAECFLAWLALSAAAILVERVHAGFLAREQGFGLPGAYSEDSATVDEGQDGVLRK